MRRRRSLAFLALTAAIIFHAAALGASLLDKDVQLMIRAIAFLRPRPGDGGIVAIAYEASDPASRQDAEAIAGYFGDGLKAGNAVLFPRLVDGGQLAAGGFVAIITASGANIDLIAAAQHALHVPCLTGDASLVRSGRCVVAVRSEPKVEISVSRMAAANGDVTFASAFLMMVNQF
jgi:hypothetical protein